MDPAKICSENSTASGKSDGVSILAKIASAARGSLRGYAESGVVENGLEAYPTSNHCRQRSGEPMCGVTLGTDSLGPGWVLNVFPVGGFRDAARGIAQNLQTATYVTPCYQALYVWLGKTIRLLALAMAPNVLFPSSRQGGL